MANYSYTELEITSNKTKNYQIQLDDIEQFKKEFDTFVEESSYGQVGWINPIRLQKDDSSNERAKYSTATITYFQYEKDSIFMTLEGRWCSPSQLFIDLCKKYELNLKYIDRENGWDFTHVVIMENGKIKKNKQSDYISALAINFDKELVFNEIIEIFENTEYFDDQDDVNSSIKEFLKDEDYFYLKKALRQSTEYKNFLKYAKDFYDRE